MTILIGDDHSVVRKGLRTILNEAYPSAQIEEACDGTELLDKALQQNWDIVISDISMPGLNGIEVLKEIKEIKPKQPILMLSIHTPEQYAVRTLKAGASGYLSKESAPEELVIAINHILSGRKYITPEIAELLLNTKSNGGIHLNPHESLSDREFEVLKLIASGKTVSQIAEILFLSIHTISTYRSRILEKMQMTTNAELTKYAITNQLA